ncbi:MAG: superoxide dismutase family protein [Lachnospiraceae bacterium]|nr:superoxide dismutase family protein [Lachnospiraceae bacterium]
MQTQQPQPTPRLPFIQLLAHHTPQAMAWVRGGAAAPGLSGLVKFFDTPYEGVLVEAEIFGLPNLSLPGSSDFYAMHIHESGDCSGHFTHTGGHYNPTHQLHPQHAGDLPPLLGSQGYAWTAFYDKRFRIKEIIGRSVIIHSMPDDFTSQPSGNPGIQLGCGAIREL